MPGPPSSVAPSPKRHSTVGSAITFTVSPAREINNDCRRGAGSSQNHDDAPVKPVKPNTVARSLAIGSPADGDLAVATARATGGSIDPVPEDEVGANMSLLAETAGVFGETAAGVTLGALRAVVARGDLGSADRVVLLVTGDGLKTPGPVLDRFRPIEIEADADALLEQLGVAA